MRFFFPHSHAFPGGRVRVEDEADTEAQCLVEFADGVVVAAECHRTDDGIRLAVPAYRTSKGHLVAAHTWQVVQRQDGVWRSERGA